MLSLRLNNFFLKLHKFSQATFGTNSERDSLGPLKHLQLEVEEAIVEHLANNEEEFLTEMSDCFMLMMDALDRRGFSFYDLLESAERKLEIVESRVYPKPKGNEISQHVED